METRRKLTLFAGVISAVFAALLLALAVFLALTTGDARQSTVFAIISVFPLLIAIACLSRRHRTIALRLVGGVTAIAMTGIIINSFVKPDIEIGRRGRAIYFAILAGAVAIAAKGRWPSNDADAPNPADN